MTDADFGPRARPARKQRDSRWESVKRHVQLLARLEGEPLRLDGQLYLVKPTKVREPSLVIETLRTHGELEPARFPVLVKSERPPMLVTRELLATARRNLLALSAPPALAIAREHRRALARYGTIDAAWLKERSARLDELSAALHALKGTTADPKRWFDSVREIVRLVHGEASLSALDELAAKTASLGAERRRNAAAVREDALHTIAFYSLLFRLDDAGAPLVGGAELAKARDKMQGALEVARVDLTAAEVLGLLDLPFQGYARKTLASFVAEGVPLDLIAHACKEGHGKALLRAPSARAARAFATWATRLVPHYRSLGIEFTLSPEVFAHLPRSEDLAVLGVCLMEQEPSGAVGKATGVDPIAVLDATLGLFKNVPAKASGLLGRLKGTSAGAGRAAFPELASWLDDDLLLDRYVHLTRIAGLPGSLTKQLREDFDHAEKVARERAHLLALPSRHERQEARLRTLLASERTREGSPRARTKRRFAERIDELLPIAYRRELDGAFREILREAWGIRVDRMTPAWRDAVRFWLVVENNRELLGRVLRACSDGLGTAVKRTFPENEEWLARVKGRMNVEEWLTPRRVSFEEEGVRYELSLEENPLEVLRMGIPFATCLSLEDGVNAASTVINAVDANKHVLYVRTKDGRVVARKLIGLTKELRLVGYKLYVALKGPGERAIRVAVDAFCIQLANAAGIETATSGTIERIHRGFWYDDGTVPWSDDVDVASYCHALDLAPPPKWYDALATEARGHEAMIRGDIEGALSVLTRWDSGPANTRLGDFLAERLGEPAVVRRAEEYGALVQPALRVLAAPDEDGLLRAMMLATRLPDERAASMLEDLLLAFPRSTRSAMALADLTVRSLRVTPSPSRHGLAHLSFEIYKRLDDVAPSFDVLDRVQPAWEEIANELPGCKECHRFAVQRSIFAVRRAYARAPDDDAVTACLMSRRRGTVAHRAALAIAASYKLSGGARAIERLRVLRPELAGDPSLFAAVLRQEDVGAISASFAKRLPEPVDPPFEALRDQLFSCTGLEPLLERWPTWGRRGTDDAIDRWVPKEWELAWHRYRGSARVRDELYDLASEVPVTATRAMELLASLGDEERVNRLGHRAYERPIDPDHYRPPETWKTTSECRQAARASARIIADVSRGRLPERLTRNDVLDIRVVTMARNILVTTSSESALAVVSAWPRRMNVPELETLLVPIAARGDARSLQQLLANNVKASEQLHPPTIAAVWQVEEARPALVRALVLGRRDFWAPIATATERFAAAREASCDGLFEAWALALLEAPSMDQAVETESLDQLRVVIRTALQSASPQRAAELYEELLDELSASIFLKALARLPRDRAAAVRDAANKLRFLGERGAARKAWLLATRPLKKSQLPSIERG